MVDKKKPDNYKYIRWSMTPLKIENRKLHKHHVYLHRYTVCFIRHAFELKKRKKTPHTKSSSSGRIDFGENRSPDVACDEHHVKCKLIEMIYRFQAT